MDVQEQSVTETPLPAETPITSPVDESSSLSDHEAQFAPGASEAEPEPEAGSPEAEARDGRGRYKSRGSRATAEDVPRIQALTRDKRTIEAERDALKAELDKQKTPAAPQTPAPVAGTAAPRPAAQPSAQPLPQAFPSYEAFIAIPGNEEVTYDDYRDIREDWRYQVRRQTERQQEVAEREQKTAAERVTAHQARLKDVRAKYPDWDAVVPNDLPISKVLHDAILASDQSTDIQYWLGQNRDECAALVGESLEYSTSAVNAMRRYLEKAVTASTPARNVAAPTGSALALVPPPAPRPPNPVRTGTHTPSDGPPGDEDSLAAHEKFYGRARR